MFRSGWKVCGLLGILLLSPQPLRSEPTVVVELFTSQGCSSCPPADAFLGELAARDDVLAFSEHVKYWDYLGWIDPLAIHASGERQRDYARHLGLSYVYTPQVVINGETQARGNDRSEVLKLINRARHEHTVSLAVEPAADGSLLARIDGEPRAHEADILLVRYSGQRVTDVKRGENRGQQMVNHNVVLDLRRLAGWKGGAMQVPIDVSYAAAEGEGVALLLQDRGTGHILAATRLQAPSENSR